MKVTILGSGSFFVSKDRSGPAYLLEANDKKFLIDCGPGTLNRLSQLGVALEDIDYILLSHFHPDHTSDLFALQMSFRLRDFFGEQDYKTPIIYGPAGVESFTRRLSEVYQLPAFDNYDKINIKSYNPSLRRVGLI
jgi:ribonuclease BN (tRNA processing enzyme)